MCCSPSSQFKLLSQINDEKKDTIENTTLGEKDHRQLMQRSFCIESLLKPATAEALKIVVNSDVEKKKSSSSPKDGAPVSPPSSPQSPSSSSSAAAGPTITSSSAPFMNVIQGLPRASPLMPHAPLFPSSHPGMYQGYPNLFSVPPHGLVPHNGGGPPSSDSSATSPANPPPTHHSFEGVLKNNQHQALNMQTMQLEWLARTGMLYHRFPELAGTIRNLKK